ncbi:MAG: hypothetical protein ACHQ1G_05830 [Planctomycetota bacterium]
MTPLESALASLEARLRREMPGFITAEEGLPLIGLARAGLRLRASGVEHETSGYVVMQVDRAALSAYDDARRSMEESK